MNSMLRYNEMVGNLINLTMKLEAIDNGKNKFIRNIKYRKAINDSKRLLKQSISKKTIFGPEDVIAFSQFMQSAENIYHFKAFHSDDCFSSRYFVSINSNDYGGNSSYGEVSFTVKYSEYQTLRTTLSGWVDCTIHGSKYSISDMKCVWNVFLTNAQKGMIEYDPEMEFNYSKELKSLSVSDDNGPTVNEFIKITNKMLYNIFCIGIERVYDSVKMRYINEIW